MKKEYLILIILSLLFVVSPVSAQENLVDCGFAEINLSSLLQGGQNAEEIPALVCLGKQIQAPGASAKAVIGNDTYGDVIYYIERGAENQVTGKITIGKAGDMVSDAQKPFAETFFVCPTDITAVKLENPELDLDALPGALAVALYKKLTVLSADPVTNNCVGTYFTVANEIKNATSSEEVIDERPMFNELITSFLIANIESGAELTVSDNIVGCSNSTEASETECNRYFYGSKRDQFGNPERNFSLRLIKQNEKTAGKYDANASMKNARNRFNELTTIEYAPKYTELTEEISRNLGEASMYEFLEYSNARKLIVVNGTWIIEINYTSDINNNFVAGVASEILSEIDKTVESTIEKNSNSESAKDLTKTSSTTPDIVGPVKPIEKDTSLLKRLLGKIIIKVQSVGEAYYVDPNTKKTHYLGKPDDALKVMRERGIGITNANLNKIQLGLGKMSGPDTDGDGLSDIFEDAIKTDKAKVDSDGDTYSDKDELNSGFDPRSGAGKKMEYSLNFATEQKGKIFLQVEGNGEAWYLNPSDNKRYFMGRPTDAYNLMRTFGLGISNADFATLESQIN